MRMWGRWCIRMGCGTGDSLREDRERERGKGDKRGSSSTCIF